MSVSFGRDPARGVSASVPLTVDVQPHWDVDSRTGESDPSRLGFLSQVRHDKKVVSGSHVIDVDTYHNWRRKARGSSEQMDMRQNPSADGRDALMLRKRTRLQHVLQTLLTRGSGNLDKHPL